MILTCETCKKEFERKNSEAIRNANLGMRTFCSRSCRGKKIYEDIPISKRANCNNLKKKQLDEFSPFRPHLKSIKCHAKKINKLVELNLIDLKKQWEKQNGICSLTGWKMTNYLGSRDKPTRIPERASLDRIDSNEGYFPENVRFICMIAQFAKNNFCDEDVIRFCKAVTNNKAN